MTTDEVMNLKNQTVIEADRLPLEQLYRQLSETFDSIAITQTAESGSEDSHFVH